MVPKKNFDKYSNKYINNNTIIIKFGGSAITDKSIECTYRKEIVKGLIKELARFYDEHSFLGNKDSKKNKNEIYNRPQNAALRLILVHGAGSFGHIKAKRYELDAGYNFQSADQLVGLSIVHNDVRKLNSMFMTDLSTFLFPVISISPLTIIKYDNKKLKTIELDIFDSIIHLNLIPVSYGDVVIDDTFKFSICSGDTIVQHLAMHYKPRCVIFLTGVDGLCDKNPQIHKDSKLITTLNHETFSRACTNQNIDPDVTGGIFQKCKIALELAHSGIKTYIINGMKPNRFYKALSGSDVVGTIAT